MPIILAANPDAIPSVGGMECQSYQQQMQMPYQVV